MTARPAPPPTVDRLRAIVGDVLEISDASVAEDASLDHELAVDSLEKVEIVARVAQEFGVALSPERAAELDTVSEFVAALRSTTGHDPRQESAS